jgi:hypothetical protein
MKDDSLARWQQLQAEEMAVRQLLEGKLSDHTRPHLEELLRMIREEISSEKKAWAARQGA